jgi:hypothetical protein
VFAEVQTLGGQRALAVAADPVTGTLSADDADWILVAPASWDLLVVAGAQVGGASDLDGDGQNEAWLADDDASDGRGELSYATWGHDLTLARRGELGEALGGALWSIGDTDGTGGGDLVWRTATGSSRLGASCR